MIQVTESFLALELDDSGSSFASHFPLSWIFSPFTVKVF